MPHEHGALGRVRGWPWPRRGEGAVCVQRDVQRAESGMAVAGDSSGLWDFKGAVKKAVASST